jgi:polyferredoxin
MKPKNIIWSFIGLALAFLVVNNFNEWLKSLLPDIHPLIYVFFGTFLIVTIFKKRRII